MDTRRCLLIDADDTLWENNIYFIEVTNAFVTVLGHHNVSPDVARRHLLSTESRNIPIHGYGSRAFALSIVEAYETLVPAVDGTVAAELAALAHAIWSREQMELLPGVLEALDRLAVDNRLILVTKGEVEEQERKLERSGLRRHFEWVEV